VAKEKKERKKLQQ